MSKFERFEFIKNCLCKKKYISYEEVNENFHISKRQFLRDISEIREIFSNQYSIEIKYSREKDRYFIDVDIEIDFYYGEKTLLFYAFLKSISNTDFYIPFVMDEVLKKLSSKMDKEYLKLSSRITYQLEESSSLNHHNFKLFIDGLKDRKRLKVLYENNKGIKNIRLLEPLYFVNYASQWYFICYDCGKNSIRNFNAGRIKNVELTDETCKNYVSDSELKKYLESGFGIYKEKNVKIVKIRFYGKAYNIVKYQKWHKSEERNEGVTPDGKNYLELRVPVGNYEEIIGKILRYLPEAEAIEPEDFRQMWLNKIEEARKKFF